MVDNKTNIIKLLLVLVALMLMPVFSWADTTVYFIRHVEVNMDDPDKPLTDEGKARVIALADHMKDIPFTHILSTHFDRNMETVAKLAEDKNIEITQVPKRSDEITNRSKGKVAVKPMVQALKSLDDGSVVLVSANSGNLFKIMKKIGVETGGDAVPCGGGKCFPKQEFDNIWKVVISGGDATVEVSKY